MAGEKERIIEGAELRSRAEGRLAEKRGPAVPAGTGEDAQRLLHELQVHQIELEMQNEGLLQARAAVENALEKYTDLYDFAPVAYVTLDRSGGILGVNLTGATLLGVERSRLIGLLFGRFLSAETRFRFPEFLGKVFTSRAKQACELSLVNGEHSPLIVRVVAVADTSGLECRMALIDMTEHRLVEESLRKEKEISEALRQANLVSAATDRAKSLFIANMSHELRNPMTSILAFLQLSLAEELTPLQREYLETTLRSARSLLRILDDVLDMAKIEAGQLGIEDEKFSLAICVSDVVDSITPEIQRKGLDIALSVAEGIPGTVVGDRIRLRQVLTNLIGNAVKFTEEGKVDVQVTAAAPTSGGKREFIFTVRDTGIGIPDDKKGLLFRRFSQVDPSHSRMYGGAGLGLSISREIVELMGGRISFNSQSGVGSTFSFTIPLRDVTCDSVSLSAVGPRSPEWMIDPAGERIPRILLAEDDPDNRKAFGTLFRMNNYAHDLAENGLEAIEMWEKGDYDLVLMDVQMPQLDGFEAARAIRKKERERGGHTPIVALTAHSFKEDKEKCLAAGMDAYITKPIDINKFLQLIGGIIKPYSRGI
jgi:signal transduction histidine kinase